MVKILICFISIFILTFLLDYFLLKKFHVNELEYMKIRFKLKKSFKETKKIKLITSAINAFILTLVITFAFYCKWNLIIIFSISFILLVLLIYSMYGIYGKILYKKQLLKKRKKDKF